MRLHPFRLVEPESLPEAIDALGRLDGEARLVAGGTALVAMIRLGLVKPDHLISLHRVPTLSQIRVENGSLELGAMATHADIERSRVVRDGWPLLAEAVRRVATPAIRTSGTIGGNLAYAEAASDPAPALLCLNAEVRVIGPARQPNGADRAVLQRLLRGGAGARRDRHGDPRSAPAGRRARRLHQVHVTLGGGQTAGRRRRPRRARCLRALRDIRLALGGAAPTPIRAEGAERTLRGEALTDAAVRAAADLAAQQADPLTDLMGSADYRREMIRVWVRRLLVALRDGER